MAFDPKKQRRANIFREDLARLEAAAERLGWPEHKAGATALIRRVCEDWLSRVEGNHAGRTGELPSIAELAARLARVERRLELPAPVTPQALTSDSPSKALPSPEPSGGESQEAPQGNPRKKASESREHHRERPEGETLVQHTGIPEPGDWTAKRLDMLMSEHNLSAKTLGASLGYKNKGTSVGYWRRGEKPIPAERQVQLTQHFSKLAKSKA